jgi:general secretion pathway protein J
LKNAPAGAAPLSFSGEPRTLRFVSPLPAHLGAGGMHWFTVSVTEAAEFKRLALSHELFQREEWERFVAPEPSSTLLADGLRDAQFDYFGQDSRGEAPAWVARWQDKDRLPQLVRLRLLAADGSIEELLMAPRLAK